MTADRVWATRRIGAPAAKIFDIVSSPEGHVLIDGSGMLTAAAGTERPTAVGDTFDMDMDRRPLNDIPNLTDYQVRNTVTRFIPNRLFEWGIGGVNTPPLGHVYGWEIEPDGEGACQVTNYCDWTGIGEELRSRREWPIVPVEMLERSVHNLERIVTEAEEEAS